MNRNLAVIGRYSGAMTHDPSAFSKTLARRPGDPLRVLIVDDDPEIAQMLKEAVEDMGDAAEVCHDGRGAVTLTLAMEPDVVLLDLSLPDMDGLKVAQTLRDGAGGGRALKIVAVTGYGDAEARRKTAAAGFDLHLAKPVRLEILESMLDLLRSAPVVS